MKANSRKSASAGNRTTSRLLVSDPRPIATSNPMRSGVRTPTQHRAARTDPMAPMPNSHFTIAPGRQQSAPLEQALDQGCDGQPAAAQESLGRGGHSYY